MSDFDSLSDSDWLDISSNRESDDDSVISGDSDREEIGRMPLSRRSSMSVGSSREGDIEAWEGFVDDSGDEGTPRSELGDRVVLTADLCEPIDGQSDTNSHHDLAEEERVKEALDQSLISTLSASRSATASAQNSIRDLRLSFPDPLTSSHDELHRAYDDPSDTTFTSTDVPIDDVADAGEVTDEEGAEQQSYHPSPSLVPEVVEQVISPEIHVLPREKAEFDVVLYGSSSPIKWSFVQTLVEKAMFISGRTVTGSTICTEKRIMFLHLERQIAPSLSIREFVTVHDRTDNVIATDAPVSQDPKRPSLAIVYLPSIIDSLPEQHTLYLPVLLPSASSTVGRVTARSDWKTLAIPKYKVVRLTKDVESPIFNSESITEIPQMRTHRLLERLISEAKKRPARTISEHLRPAHAVTLFALVSLVVGFTMNTGFRKTYAPTPTTTTHALTSVWGMFGPEINRTAIMPATTTARINAPVATTSSKDLSLSLYNPGTTSSALTLQSRQPEVSVSVAEVTSTSSKAEGRGIASDVIVRPATQLSIVQPEPSVAMVLPHPTAGPSGTKSNSRVSSVVESISGALDLHVRSLRHELDELVESLDELSRAVRRQTKVKMQQSKGKAKELRDNVQYRHERARGNAKALKKRGEVVMSFAGEQFIGRTDLAKQKARQITKSLVTSDAWRVYQAAQVEWASMLKEKGGGEDGGGKGENKGRSKWGGQGGKCIKRASKLERKQTNIFFSYGDVLA